MKDFIIKQKWVILITIFFAIGVFFRFYKIDSIPPGLFSDEAVNGVNTLQANETGDYKLFYKENNGREGLFINIQAISVKVFGNTAWALRIVSGLFGSLTILGVYFLARQLFLNNIIAVFSAFFMATSFWHINFSRIGFRAITAPFFLTWGVYFLWKAIDYIPDPTKKFFKTRGLALASLGGFVFGLGFHSYIAYRIAPVLLVFPVLIAIKKKKYKELLLGIVFALIAIAPLALYFYQHPQEFLGRTSQVSIFTAENPPLELLKNVGLTISMFFFFGDFNWRHNYSGNPELWWPVAAMFLFGMVVSIAKIFSKKEEADTRLKYAFLISWLGVMLAPVVISSEGIPHSLRAIIVIPVVMIISAIGFDYAWKKFENKKQLGAVLVGLLVAGLISNTYQTYFVDWAQKPQVATSFNKSATDGAYYLNALPKETPKYVILKTDGQAPMSINTVTFLTGTYFEKYQKEKNISYVFIRDAGTIPDNAIKIWID